MKKYFLHNGKEQLGPFDVDDLKSKHINKDTPIWHDGLPAWTTAEKIDELRDILQSSTPPPFETKQSAPPFNKQTPGAAEASPQRKSNTGKIILIAAIVLIGIVGGLAIFNSKNSGGNGSRDSYEQKVMTVEEIERSSPTDFLSATGTYKENFWGDKFKINCVITNKATVATYKDPVIQVTYYSKTKTALATNKYTVYEIFPPTSTKTVEMKIDNYKDVSSLGWDVISAKPN